MGFYGNITNTAKTQFTFDRIYPNRLSLQQNCPVDGIYIGRFVLIEYDTQGLDTYNEVFYGNSESLPRPAEPYYTYLYTQFRPETLDTIIKYSDVIGDTSVSKGSIVVVYPDRDHAEGHPVSSWIAKLYQCVGKATIQQNNQNVDVAVFMELDSSATNYSINYNIDKEAFSDPDNKSDIGRGWDSTVWQKTYANGVEKYVMIAELNTVVPTFDISSDAPTMSPMSPHFDTNSTNVYYKLHSQPQWGLRIKSAEEYSGKQLDSQGHEIDNTIVEYSSDKKKYLSDSTTTWSRTEYDKTIGVEKTVYYHPSTGTWEGPGWVFENGKQEGEKTPDGYTYGEEFPAAVYFNKAGFEPEIDVKSEDNEGYYIENNIQIAPTGLSGHLYNTHSHQGMQPAEDIQELTVNLPVIGDSISKMWDIVYGNRLQNGTNGEDVHPRNMDIAWETPLNTEQPLRQGLRLVKETEDGFTYEPDQVNTLAGCLNSIHDLMGMILCTDGNVNARNARFDKIYYQGNAYKYKHNKYKFISIEDNPEEYYEFVKLEHVTNIPGDIPEGKTIDDVINEDRFNPEQLYTTIDNKEYNPVDSKAEYNKDTDYYVKRLIKTNYEKVELAALGNPDKPVYYKDSNDSYIVETSETGIAGETYYTISDGAFVLANLDGTYQSYKYYYEVDGDWILETSEYAIPGRTYYELVINELSGKKWYQPYTYFYQNEESTFIVDKNPTMTEGRQYYEISVGQGGASGGNTVLIYRSVGTLSKTEWEKIPNYYYYIAEYDEYNNPKYELSTEYVAGTEYFEKEWIPNDDQEYNAYPIQEGTLIDYSTYKNNAYYKEDANYILADKDKITDYLVSVGTLTLNRWKTHYYYYYREEDVNKTNPILSTDYLSDVEYFEVMPFYLIDKNTANVYNNFYIPETFYYKEENNWIKDLSTSYDDTKEHYKLADETKITEVIIYKPDTYFYIDEDGDYILDENLTPTEGRQYYRYCYYYVWQDTRGIYSRYSIWNNTIKNIPTSIILAVREDSYELRTLTGFARTLNTIHGLILEINKLIDFGCKATRDTKTVQGCINYINDIIAKFAELNPGDILVVDSYGRIHGAPHTSAQEFSVFTPTENYNTKAQESGLLEDRWIYLNVDYQADNPKLTIEHRYNPVSSINTYSDLNRGNLDENAIVGNQHKNERKDNIVIDTPIVDSMGHVVGINTENIILPFGYKTFETNTIITSGENPVDLDGKNAASTIADNTQDKMFINNINKWVQIAIDNDNISIAHEVHPITTTDKDLTDLDTVQEFTVQDSAFDAAGHMTHNQKHTYKLPDGFKFLDIGAESTTTEDVSANSSQTTIEADNQVARVAINSGNRWIKLNANSTTDTLLIGHARAGAASQYDKQSNAQVPKFGETFNIPYNGYDQTGHLSSLNSIKVTIPKPSLTNFDATTSSVLTGISLIPEEGKFGYTVNSVGSLALTGYTIATSEGSIAEADTINQAFGKIQLK